MDKPWFNWEGGIVPYYYNASVTKDDRNMMRQIMNEIEKKICYVLISILTNILAIKNLFPNQKQLVYSMNDPPRNQSEILNISWSLLRVRNHQESKDDIPGKLSGVSDPKQKYRFEPRVVI